MATPTIEAAQAILARARKELRLAKGNELKRRQAAEKGWLAVRTAAAAVLHCAGKDWRQAKDLSERTRVLEQQLDPHQNPVLAAALAYAQSSLHGQCFYIGEEETCRPGQIGLVLDQIERALYSAVTGQVTERFGPEPESARSESTTRKPSAKP